MKTIVFINYGTLITSVLRYDPATIYILPWDLVFKEFSLSLFSLPYLDNVTLHHPLRNVGLLIVTIFIIV